MTCIKDILDNTELEGRTTRAAAEEAYARVSAECPGELAAMQATLVLNEFVSLLGTRRRSINTRHRNTTVRREQFEQGVNPVMESIMTRRTYVVSGINMTLGKLGPDDRRWLLNDMTKQIETRHQEREFLAKIDEMAGERTVEDALTDAEIKAIADAVFTEHPDD